MSIAPTSEKLVACLREVIEANDRWFAVKDDFAAAFDASVTFKIAIDKARVLVDDADASVALETGA